MFSKKKMFLMFVLCCTSIDISFGLIRRTNIESIQEKGLLEKRVHLTQEDIDQGFDKDTPDAFFLNDNPNPKNYPNAHILENQTYVCNDGYITDKVGIEEHGCFACPRVCPENSACLYPGNCGTPFPYMQSVNQDFYYGSLVYEFGVDAFDFHPTKGYCKIDNKVKKAEEVTDTSMSCDFSDKNFRELQISFDGKLWSYPYTNHLYVPPDPRPKSGLLIISAVLVVISVIALYRKQNVFPASSIIKEHPRRNL